MVSIYWLIAFVILVGIEILTMALTTIWFAGGAFVAFILSLFGVNIVVQLVSFLLVSFVLLFLTRPFASQYLNRSVVKTNAESLVGQKARVTAQIDNRAGTGSAVVNGQEWTARAADDSEIYDVETEVWIEEIRGVKLIVSGKKEEL